MSELEQRIVDSTKDGTFLDVLYEEYRKHIGDNDELIQTLVQLHNQEKINILSEFSVLNNDSSSSNFFKVHNILRKSLPLLNAPIDKIKVFIKQLALSAKNNMASYDLIIQFIEFCSKDINRANDLLEQELSVIDVDFDHVSTALISGYNIDRATYFDKSIDLLKHENLIVIQRTISALSRFDYTEEPRLATAATKEIISCTRTIKDEQILSTAINTLITLLADYEELEPDVIEFIEHNIGNNSPEFMLRIAQQLNYRHNSLSEKIQQLLFNFFKNLDAKNIGIIEEIDWYIYKKISDTDAIAIAKLFEYLLDNNDELFQVDILIHSLQRIQEQEYEEMLSFIFTNWLLKREMIYCISAFKLVKTTTTHQIKIGFDKEQVKTEDLVYLANKSIGWLSFQPSAALSLIISILPMCSESEIQLIKNKSFEFIALNYPPQTKAFLQEYLDSTDKNTVNFSEKLIQKLESFLEEFNKFYEMKELRPNTKQRIEYANYQQKLFDEAASEPTESLFFSNLFTKRITLYGNKFIHKHKDSNGETVRQVMPFSKMSHSIDFPSLANLTPHTQEYFLRLLKVEELTNEINP